VSPEADAASAVELRRRWEQLQDRIAAAGADPARTVVVAVTKGVAVGPALAAVELGLVDLGESYAQELVVKADEMADLVEARATSRPAGANLPVSPRWHFIGRLQRNKVRLVAPHVDLWQSIDRLSLAAEVARHQPGAHILVQVNVAGAEQQGGCPPERVGAVVEGCGDLGLEVRGLMAIGPQGSEDEVRAGFRAVRALADRLELPERSMGMSADLELAVGEGATMLRVGTALFGPRGR
jgi:pyridoxal phosphate enzyme (YggS family)